MTQELKDILAKKADDVTEEEKAKLTEAKTAYAQEVSDVCKRHGWQHVPFLEVTASGIVPRLAIIPFEETVKEEAPAPVEAAPEVVA